MPLGLTVNTNVSALIVQRILSNTNLELQRSVERLSSGSRVPRASSDPAAFATATFMQHTIVGINQGITNTAQSLSLAQTAEGLFDEMTNLLNSMKALALHAANTGPNDVTAIEQDQAQIRTALDALTDIATTRKFGTKVLFDGNLGKTGFTDKVAVSFVRAGINTITTQELDNLGAALTATIIVTAPTPAVFASVRAVGTFGDGTASLQFAEALVINGVTINLTVGMSIGNAVTEINTFKAQTGVSAYNVGGAGGTLAFNTLQAGSAFTITISTNQSNTAGNTSGLGGANTVVAGTDVAGEFYLRLGGAGGASASFVFSATGAGQYLFARETFQSVDGTFGGVAFSNRQVSLQGLKVLISTLVATTAELQLNQNPVQFQIGEAADDDIQQVLLNMQANVLGLSGELNQMDVRSVEGANQAIDLTDEALRQLVEMRGSLGSVQKQFLQSNLNNLLIYKENYVAAKSVIQDADFGEELVNFTRQQILLQVGTAMLAQANISPQVILSFFS